MVKEQYEKVLKQLSKDVTQSYTEIGDALGLAKKTVRTAIAHLEEDGILTGYRPKIDLEKLGYTTTNVVFIELNPDVLQPFKAIIDFHDNTVKAYQTRKPNILILVLKNKNNDGFTADLKKLEKTGMIKKIINTYEVNILKEEDTLW